MAQILLLQPTLSEFRYLGSKLVLDNTGTILLGGIAMNKNLTLAALLAGSAVIANITKTYILPKIPTKDLTIKENCTKGS
jgi:hypothetical protein